MQASGELDEALWPVLRGNHLSGDWTSWALQARIYSRSNATRFVPKQDNLLRYPPDILQGLFEGSGDIQGGDIKPLSAVADII